jgi:diguanylate cyclase (GGDEF)-like protein/PAS domain S-box-containing protein
MPDDLAALQAEVLRLKKVVRALMDRAERSTNLQGSEFSLFQTSLVLGDQVQARTAELEAALRDNERLYRDLAESEARYHALVDQSLVGIAIVEEGRFNYVNPRFEEMFGHSAQALAAMGPMELTAEADRAEVAGQLRRLLAEEVARVHFEARATRQGGEPIDVEVHGSATELGGRRVLVVVVNDITERCRAEREVQALQEELRQQSLHDPLTGLYNRRHLAQALGHELGLAERRRQPVSLVMGDLDHFKQVNDRHGHQAGDEVLKTFAQLLRQGTRGSDNAYRMGGEEFLLVLPGIAKPGATALAERLRLEVAQSRTAFQGAAIQVTASFGIASFPEDASDADALILAADKALYAAKAAGRNRVEVAATPARTAPSAGSQVA